MYFYYTKKNVTPFITITNLYIQRMIELHLRFNKNGLKEDYLKDLILFWNKVIVLVTLKLALRE